ncbi:MAG: OB-fold nucleic acid binding domain-containing protein, partial [Bacteroidota bacterium]
MELNEQEQLRRGALKELQDLGIEPYPADLFEINTSASYVNEHFESKEAELRDLKLAGRIMSRRIMGNASFVELQDSSGRIQLYFRRDDLCPGDDKTLYNT